MVGSGCRCVMSFDCIVDDGVGCRSLAKFNLQWSSAILVVGGLATMIYGFYLANTNSSHSSFMMIAAILGAILLVLGGLGLIAAGRKGTTFMTIYLVILSIVVLVQGSVAIAALANPSWITEKTCVGAFNLPTSKNTTNVCYSCGKDIPAYVVRLCQRWVIDALMHHLTSFCD